MVRSKCLEFKRNKMIMILYTGYYTELQKINKMIIIVIYNNRYRL